MTQNGYGRRRDRPSGPFHPLQPHPPIGAKQSLSYHHAQCHQRATAPRLPMTPTQLGNRNLPHPCPDGDPSWRFDRRS